MSGSMVSWTFKVRKTQNRNLQGEKCMCCFVFYLELETKFFCLFVLVISLLFVSECSHFHWPLLNHNLPSYLDEGLCCTSESSINLKKKVWVIPIQWFTGWECLSLVFREIHWMIPMFSSDCEALPTAEVGVSVRQENFSLILCCEGYLQSVFL